MGTKHTIPAVPNDYESYRTGVWSAGVRYSFYLEHVEAPYLGRNGRLATNVTKPGICANFTTFQDMLDIFLRTVFFVKNRAHNCVFLAQASLSI